MDNFLSASDTKPTSIYHSQMKAYGKRFQAKYGQDDESSISLAEHYRQPSKMECQKLGDDSVTQAKLDFFQRKTDDLKTPKKPVKSPAKEKAHQSKLSQATLDLIRKAKQKSETATVTAAPGVNSPTSADTVSQILSKPSLRDRFANLEKIQTIRDMMCIQKYQNLVNSFEQVNNMVSYLRQRKQTPFWSVIQQQLYVSYKLNVTLSQFQQFLSVWPESFSVSWQKNEKLIRLDQLEIVPQIGVVDNRLEVFKNKLLLYLHEHGECIEEAELPPRPDKPKVETIEEHVQKVEATNDEKSKKAKAYEILKRIAQHQQETRINLAKYKQQTNTTGGQSHQFSFALMEKVKEREKQLLETKMAEPKVTHDQIKLNHVSNVIQSYYQMRQVSNMFLVNVVAYVKNNKKFILSENEIMEFIKTLAKFCPNWLQIVENQQGSILRLNKSVMLPTILKEIESQCRN